MTETHASDEWLASLPAVMAEVTGGAFDGAVSGDAIDGLVRPVYAVSMLELMNVRAHSWMLNPEHSGQWHELMESATREARHVDFPQALHHHRSGEVCNRLCRIVLPDWDAPTRKGSARERNTDH